MKSIIIVIAIAAVGAAAFYFRPKTPILGGSASGPVRPTTAIVIQTNISFAVNAAGEITPAEQVSVRPEINGRIELLTVDIGDRVKKGDLLFKLDDAELQNQR